MIGELQRHVTELENKFRASEVMGKANTSPNQETTRIEYFTDEDELAEETEWIRAQNKCKKRKMNTSPLLNNSNGGTQNHDNKRKKDTTPSTDNEGERTSLPQRQTTSKPRKPDNAPETRNQNSVLQKDNREMTYAQTVAKPNKQHNVQENEDVKQTLQLILDKLIKQEALFTAFDECIRKLEYSAQEATLKLKQKLIALSKLWRGMPMGSCSINRNCRLSLTQEK